VRPEGVHGVDDVVSQDRERRLGLNSPQPAGLESPSAGHSLDRAEGVLDRASARHHLAWISVNPGLHSIKRDLVEESVDRSLGAGSALLFKPTCFAGRGSIADRAIARVFARGLSVSPAAQRIVSDASS
jgi:hypothetical protein